MGNDTYTATIRGTNYTVTRETDPDDDQYTPARQLGWITGPRGANGMIVRLQPSGVIAVMARPNTTLGRYPAADVNAALTPLFT